MSTKRRQRHRSEQIVSKLRDADAMLNSRQDLAAVLQSLEVSEATYHRWRFPLRAALCGSAPACSSG